LNTSEVEAQIREVFGGPLSERGFAAMKEVKFVREHGDALQIIAFPYEFRPTLMGTRRIRFALFFSNRFPVLEGLYAPEDEVDRYAPAVGTPLYVLRPDKTFNVDEWYLDRRRTASTVLAQIDEFGIPFLNRYSDLSEVERRLESDSPSDWFGLGSEGRTCLLASIALLANDRTEALRLVDAALAELRNERAEKRWLLKQFRKRIELKSA
jgi:hypothetical protein